MCELIKFGDINKNIIYVVIGGVGKIFAELTYKMDDSINNNIKSHPFIIGIASAMGMCLSIFPLIFLKIKTKRTRKTIYEENRTSLIINEEENAKKEEKKKRQLIIKYLLILAVAFLDFAQKILSFLFVGDIDYNFWIFDMLFLSVFSYIILNSKLYIHQYISISILFVLGIALNIINLYDVIDNNRLKNIGLVFLIEVIYSLINVINKYSMEYCYCVPYEISFYQGLFALIVFATLLVIFTNIEVSEKYKNIIYNEKYYLDNFFSYIEDISYKKIMVFISIMITRLCFNLFSHITVKFFTPSHVSLILLIGEITFIFEEKEETEKGKSIWRFYGNIIILIICIPMLLIYTEILELNFCGLSENTRKNISDRASRQSNASDDSNDVGEGLLINSEGSGGDNTDLYEDDDDIKKKKTEEKVEDKELLLIINDSN